MSFRRPGRAKFNPINEDEDSMKPTRQEQSNQGTSAPVSVSLALTAIIAV